MAKFWRCLAKFFEQLKCLRTNYIYKSFEKLSSGVYIKTLQDHQTTPQSSSECLFPSSFLSASKCSRCWGRCAATYRLELSPWNLVKRNFFSWSSSSWLMAQQVTHPFRLWWIYLRHRKSFEWQCLSRSELCSCCSWSLLSMTGTFCSIFLVASQIKWQKSNFERNIWEFVSS